MSDKKIGAGHAQAMVRLGLNELRNVFTFAGSNITAPTDPGLYGNATQSEVRDQKGIGHEPQEKEQESVLESRLNQADKLAEASRDSRARDQRSFEKE